MYLAGLNIQVGKFFGLKVIIGKKLCPSPEEEYFSNKEDDSISDRATCDTAPTQPLPIDEHFSIYSSKGTRSMIKAPSGSVLKVYI